MRARRRLVVRAVAPTLTALDAVRIALETTIVDRVTTRTWVVSNTEPSSKRKEPSPLAVRVLPTCRKLALNGKSWRSSASRVPPTDVPRTRPTTVTLPPHTTRLGVTAIETPVGSRGVTNERSRLRVEPAEFVATARKW